MLRLIGIYPLTEAPEGYSPPTTSRSTATPPSLMSSATKSAAASTGSGYGLKLEEAAELGEAPVTADLPVEEEEKTSPSAGARRLTKDTPSRWPTALQRLACGPIQPSRYSSSVEFLSERLLFSSPAFSRRRGVDSDRHQPQLNAKLTSASNSPLSAAR